MQNTFEIFSECVDEIEFYFSVMTQIEKNNFGMNIADGRKFYKITKSNFLLMLYNLVESCIVSGMKEVYEVINSERCNYSQLIKELQKLWAKNRISEIYGQNVGRNKYETRVVDIINDITTCAPISFPSNIIGSRGNFDARKIRNLCDSHGIRYRLSGNGEALERVKNDRQRLTHGDVSFSRGARDLTIDDLKKIKDEVKSFVHEIIVGMKDFCDEKAYKNR